MTKCLYVDEKKCRLIWWQSSCHTQKLCPKYFKIINPLAWHQLFMHKYISCWGLHQRKKIELNLKTNIYRPLYVLKVSWNQNGFMRLSFLAKYQPKIWRISALPSKKPPEQRSFKFWLACWENRSPHKFILNLTDL